MQSKRFPNFIDILQQLNSSPATSSREREDLRGGMNNVYFEKIPVKKENSEGSRELCVVVTKEMPDIE